MRYAILGDIHGNLAALDAVLEAVDRQQVDRIIQVGDVVGYGAHPREVIQRMRERDALVVMGNHDAACIGTLDPRSFNDPARIAVEYTRRQLGQQDLDWLGGLPLTASTDDCTVSHGTLHRPERFDYIQRPEDGDPSLDMLERPVCFLGHTHRPVTLMRLTDSPHRTSYTMETSLDLRENVVSLVNVGSVGQPRDDDPRAAYAIFDVEARSIELLRVDYDIEREADHIVREGLPKILADRLFLGI
jgi:diadenosine tetraphosphatase ApaH/serine/threonine PP2A family protein phosphatase